MKRKCINYVTSFIHNSGLHVLTPDSRDYNSRSTHILLLALLNYSSVIIFTSFYALENRDDFYKFINPIPYVAIVSTTLSGFFPLFYHKRILSELFFQMDDNMYTYPDEDQLQIIYKWYLQEDNIILILKSIQSFYLVNALIRGFPLFANIFYSNSKIETFVYPSWIPWPIDSRPWQCFTLIFQLSQGICGIWCFNLTLLSILTSVFEFLRQYKRLEVAVGSIWSRAEMISEGNKRKIQKMVRENIVHCIKHHQILHRNFKLFKVWMEVILTCELLICLLSLAFGLYIVVNASSFLKMYNCFEVIGIVITHLLALCIFSEIFFSLNERLTNTVFWEVDWYELSQENRKLLVIFHQMSKQQFQLFGLTIFPASRDVFGRLMKATYSIFNVLNVSIKK